MPGVLRTVRRCRRESDGDDYRIILWCLQDKSEWERYVVEALGGRDGGDRDSAMPDFVMTDYVTRYLDWANAKDNNFKERKVESIEDTNGDGNVHGPRCKTMDERDDTTNGNVPSRNRCKTMDERDD